MAMHARDLGTWRGTMNRRDYALWGCVLFAVKYNLDRAIALAFFNRPWLPWSYLTGRNQPGPPPGDDGPILALALLLLALPFVFWGVTMTLRRLRDAGWSQTLVVLFFVPFVNLLFSGSCVCNPRANRRWWRPLPCGGGSASCPRRTAPLQPASASRPA